MCTKNLSADNIGSALSGVLNSILKKDIIATPVESTKDKLTFAETPILEVVGKDLGIAQQILPGITAGLGAATPVNEWVNTKSTPAHWCTSHAVAMAEFNGKLFMAGKGVAGDERIWYSWYDGEKWQEPMPGPGWTSCGVALAVHAGKLFMAWKGMGNDQDIWFSYYDGTNWKPQVRALDTNNYSLSTTHRPALASYKNILYLFCKGSNNNTSIWCSTLQLNNSDFNLSKWTIATPASYLDEKIQKPVGICTSHSPAVAVYNNLLGMAWKGIVGDDRIFYSVYDGTKWVPQIPIPGVSTSCGPSLAPYAKFWMHTKSFDPIVRDLYGVWKGSKDNKGAEDPKIYQSAFQLFKDPLVQDNNGFLPQKLTSENFKTSDTPALAVFNNRLYMAWKNATNNRIYFSYLETGSDKREGNIFDETRKGVPVVRPDDLLALRIETRNLKVVHIPDKKRGQIPVLQKEGKDPAYIILHFPPQSFAEETFFETNPPSSNYNKPELQGKQVHKSDPVGNQDLTLPPVRARIARESRLVFIVPDGEQIAYSLEGVLEACQKLSMKVANAAKWQERPSSTRRLRDILGWDISLVDRSILRNLKAEEVVQDTLMIGQTISDVRKIFKSVQNDPVIYSVFQSSALHSFLENSKAFLEVVPNAKAKIPEGFFVTKPQPELPDDTTTSIEMPWRLIISPHDKEYWRHATKPITSATNHTELWHTRLVSEAEIEPSYPDEDRTIRAIWALSGMGAEMAKDDAGNYLPMQSKRPTTLPSTVANPFLTPLDNFDRYQIAHLSSNFNISGYEPEAVDTKTMILSALGGWLDSRGEWEPPGGLSVEEWTHRATMGRDHFVRVVYKGFLYPFGHRAALIKVSERKFHGNKRGNPAYLRQRMFLVVREKERTYDENLFLEAKELSTGNFLSRKFPFKSVRILTQTTPDLDPPSNSSVRGGQKMFWPHVSTKPFRFQCAATDIEDQEVLFELPMIFVDNTLASPIKNNKPDFVNAVSFAKDAVTAYSEKNNTADLNFKPVALAPFDKTGDTNVQVEKMTFGGFADISLQDYSQNLTRPIWVPQVVEVKARIEAIAHLSGSKETNILNYNDFYLKKGFGKDNIGQVFVNVSGYAGLDFSSQGDKSGGFIQPNLIPKALSRITGPVTSDVGKFIGGTMVEGGGFSEDLLPLLFGCIPLGEIIKSASVLGSEVPKFISEAGTKMDSFLNGIQRLVNLVNDFPTQSKKIANGALEIFKATFEDLIAQSYIYFDKEAQRYKSELMQKVMIKVYSFLPKETKIITDLYKPGKLPQLEKYDIFGEIVTKLETTFNKINKPHSINLVVELDIENFIEYIQDLSDATKIDINITPEVASSIPQGLFQSIRTATNKLTALLTQIKQIVEIANASKNLLDVLNKIIEDDIIKTLKNLTNSELLKDLRNKICEFREALQSAELLDGAPRNTLISALKTVEDILGKGEEIAKLIEMLTGDELTVRFDWNPEIKSWGLKGDLTKRENQLFRVNDPKGFLVAVEAKVKKNGASSPSMNVNCSLKNFDLVLIAPASFIELNFEKVAFMIDTGAKPNVDVKLHGIKFVGPLSFVETLRDLIPLDGFSDPPYLDITAKGIDAGFSVSLPTICIGVLNIANISLGAGFTVPFIGEPLSVRFNFCTRQQPFLLTVYGLGGGGFFGLTISPNGVQMLEAAFEFGAAISIDFGVASGGVHVMAGIYYRMEKDEASLTGFFRLGGYVSVLGLISASLELYLGLTYNFTTGKCVGIAKLTIEVSVLFFSTSVTITCERQFAGANGDPTIRQMLGPTLDELCLSEGTVISLEDEISLIKEETEYAWREYFDAFV